MRPNPTSLPTFIDEGWHDGVYFHGAIDHPRSFEVHFFERRPQQISADSLRRVENHVVELPVVVGKVVVLGEGFDIEKLVKNEPHVAFAQECRCHRLSSLLPAELSRR